MNNSIKLNILVILNRQNSPVTELLKDETLTVCHDGAGIAQTVAAGSYDIVVLEDRTDLIRAVKGADGRSEVIAIGHDRELNGVDAILEGASAYAGTPLDAERFLADVERIRDAIKFRRGAAHLEAELLKNYTFEGIVVGKSPRMLDIFTFIRRIAPYYKIVTIIGETGVGKEELAKAVHAASPRGKNPFMAYNCGTADEHLLSSEFFGHKKGAFTGAVTDRVGLFEAAGNGTVFLDEIGDLPLQLQAHLLRVLQSGEYKRVGCNNTLKINCNVITATNRDLAADVKTGRFREDLLFRIKALVISVPPLRERKDDIPLLNKFILNRFNKRTGKKISGIARDAQIAIMSYDWPGNVRELENTIEHAAILTEGPFIRQSDFPLHMLEIKASGGTGPQAIDDVLKTHIVRVLAQHDGNRTSAAKALGISRMALLRKIEKYRICE